MTLGLIGLVLSNIAAAVVPKTSVSCIAFEWLFGMGGSMAILSPLLKAFRVSRIFDGEKMIKSKKIKISDRMLLRMLIKAALIEMAICIGYTVAHIHYNGTNKHYDWIALRMETRCNSSGIVSKFRYGSLAYFFVILGVMTYFSWKTRRALQIFKESTCSFVTSFLAVFSMVISLVFKLASNDPAHELAVQSGATLMVVAVSLTLFYGPRIYVFWTKPERRDVIDKRSLWNRKSMSVKVTPSKNNTWTEAVVTTTELSLKGADTDSS